MKRLILLAGIALIAASCNTDNGIDNNSQNQPVALQVSGSIHTGAAQTRAAGDVWAAGDAIGIFMSDNTGTQAINRQHITASGDGSFTPSATAQTIYFPVDNNAPKVDFTAYYPYNAAQSGFDYAIDLSDQSSQAPLDLMTAEKITGRDKTNPAVAFNFKHRLVKMELTIAAGTGLSAADLPGITVSLGSQYTAGTCSIETGVVTPSGNTSDIALKSAADGLFSEATLLPAAASTGRVLTFTLSTGEPFRYTIPADRAFNAGEKHAYTITLDRTGVGITATITDWVSVPGSGTAK